MREFVVEVAASVDCDPAFVAWPALTVAAAVVGGALVVRAKRGFEQPPLLWLCAVGGDRHREDAGTEADREAGVYDRPPDAGGSAGEREFILSQIRVECRAGGRRASETEATQTEKDVIVQGGLYLMNQQPEFDDQTCVLLGKLRTNHLEGKTAQHEEIPAFTNIFSRRLRRLVPVLRGYGVEVGMRHQEDGSHCKLVRLGTFQREGDSATTLAKAADGENCQPSGQPSGGITKKGKEFKKADATDGENRFDDPNDKEALNGRRADLAAVGEKGGAL